MIIVFFLAGGLLAAAAAMTIARMVRGPSALDRVVAADVLLATMAASLSIEAAINRHGYTIPVILVLALLAFAGTVSIARFVAARQKASVNPPNPKAESKHEGGRP
ncbi:monovalent cation/H+ antiporter complex subunit F [Humidisolicoccus flavus]|uniref:monovalent cation/H+ antiporter complex subunit F n=1 Tax=Humidisolicoccus flavus TaxID=3111414 RepID=UPI003245A2A9